MKSDATDETDLELYILRLYHDARPGRPDEGEPAIQCVAGEPHGFLLRIPPLLWHELKSHCSRQDITMTSFVNAAIEEKLRRPHLPTLLKAAKVIVHIVDELMLASDMPSGFGRAEYKALLEAVGQFDQVLMSTWACLWDA